jgi:transposase-like protein
VDQETLVEYRYRAVCEVLGGSPIGEVALRYGTMRQSLDTWRTRFKQEGVTIGAAVVIEWNLSPLRRPVGPSLDALTRLAKQSMSVAPAVRRLVVARAVFQGTPANTRAERARTVCPCSAERV